MWNLKSVKILYIVLHDFVPAVKAITSLMCDNEVALPIPAGYIASGFDNARPTTGMTCPLKLEALPGQRIDITLYNFQYQNGESSNGPLG